VLSELEAKNNDHLKILVDQYKVDLRRFPDEVLKQLKIYSRETIDNLCSGDPQSRKVYDAFSAFQKTVNAWGTVSERAMHELDNI
jgi:TRAP-type mannitol/chloroaromatic compound transport system substrate-binding protein